MFASIQQGMGAIQKQMYAEISEESGLYIPAQGKYTTLSDETPFALAPLIKQFANWDTGEEESLYPARSSNTKVLLLTGDAGSGKSLFGQDLIRTLWRDYRRGQPIPLWINLPELQNPLHQAIEETLRGYGFNVEQIAQLKREQQFFFILDGYDELHQWQNLYVTNRLNEWQAKTVITCRSQALYGIQDVDKYFMPFEGEKRRQDLLSKVAVAPFTREQIESYLQQFNACQKLTTPLTCAQLEDIPGLSQLITTPFLLHLAAEALPEIQKKYLHQSQEQQKNITQSILYDVFIEQWFQRQETKLKTSGAIPEDQDPKPLFWRYCQSLAQQMHLQQTSVVTYQPSGHGGLFDTTQNKVSPWAAFFETDKETAQVRSACPLKQYDQHRYGFWHTSLMEYFATRAMYVQANVPAVAEEKEESPEATLFGSTFIHQKLFAKNLNMIRFLSDRVGESDAFKQMLFKVIEYSKTDERYAIGAANAITALNTAREVFSAKDFIGIRISGADLSGAILDHTQLQKTDLSGVNLKGAWLRKANFMGAQMNTIDFGEYPSIILEDRVRPVAYFADGDWLAVGSGNGVYLYGAKTQKLNHTFTGHTGWVASIAFGPSNLLASCSEDNTVRLWDIKTKRPLATLEGHTNVVYSVAFGPGNLLASGSWDNTVRLWDAKTKRLLATLEGHTELVYSVVFGPSNLLASGGADNTVRLWDVKTKQLLQALEGHTGAIRSIAFGPDNLLASGSEDNTVRLWDVKSKQLLATLKGHANVVYSVAFGSGNFLASGSHDGTVRLWDVKTKQLLQTLEGHTGAVMGIAFGPNHLVSGSEDNTVRLWDVNAKPIQTLEGHTRQITSVVFGPGNLLASGSWDNTVRLWDVKTKQPLATLEGHTDIVSSIVFGPGNLLASGSWDNTVRLWDVKTKQLLQTLEGHTKEVESVAFGPGNLLASGSWDNTVRLWDVKTKQLLATLEGHTKSVESVAFGPGNLLASGSVDNTVRLWDVKTKQLLQTLEGHTKSVESVAFGPGNLLASGSVDNTVRLWDVKTKQLLQTLEGHTRKVTSIAFGPGDILASGSEDTTVRLWDVKTYGCLAIISGFMGSINSVAWQQVAGELYLATGGNDKAVRYWQVISDSKTLRVILRWSTYQAALVAADADLSQIQGLNETNYQLLIQRGAIEKPSRFLEEKNDPENKIIHSGVTMKISSAQTINSSILTQPAAFFKNSPDKKIFPERQQQKTQIVEDNTSRCCVLM